MKNYFSNRSDKDIEKQLQSLKQLMSFFKEKCGIWAYLIYGTLLGAVRERDVIANDTDYDIAILLKGNTKEEIINSFKSVGKVLIEYNMLKKLWINSTPQTVLNPSAKLLELPLGQLHVLTPDKKCCIDVWLSWIKDGKYYLHKGVGGALETADIVPFKFGYIRDIRYVIPNNSESILKHIYGYDWRQPKNIKSTRQKFTMRELYNE